MTSFLDGRHRRWFSARVALAEHSVPMCLPGCTASRLLRGAASLVPTSWCEQRPTGNAFVLRVHERVRAYTLIVAASAAVAHAPRNDPLRHRHWSSDEPA
jgi:hypothetical protein